MLRPIDKGLQRAAAWLANRPARFDVQISIEVSPSPSKMRTIASTLAEYSRYASTPRVWVYPLAGKSLSPAFLHPSTLLRPLSYPFQPTLGPFAPRSRRLYGLSRSPAKCSTMYNGFRDTWSVCIYSRKSQELAGFSSRNIIALMVVGFC